jgi:hypothetical protein
MEISVIFFPRARFAGFAKNCAKFPRRFNSYPISESKNSVGAGKIKTGTTATG